MLGGIFVNNFNQFGRQYKTYVMADADLPDATGRNFSNFIHAMRQEKWFRQEQLPILEILPVRSIPITLIFTGLQKLAVCLQSGYSSAQALNALKEVARRSIAC